MEYLRVLLANHHPIVRNGLRSLLERDSNIRVVGEAANGQEAILLAQLLHPDIAILDVELRSMRGINAARIVCAREPRTRVIILGTSTDESYVQETFHSGALGYVLGDAAETDLRQAVHVIATGGTFVSPLIGSQLISASARPSSQ